MSVYQDFSEGKGKPDESFAKDKVLHFSKAACALLSAPQNPCVVPPAHQGKIYTPVVRSLLFQRNIGQSTIWHWFLMQSSYSIKIYLIFTLPSSISGSTFGAFTHYSSIYLLSITFHWKEQDGYKLKPNIVSLFPVPRGPRTLTKPLICFSSSPLSFSSPSCGHCPAPSPPVFFLQSVMVPNLVLTARSLPVFCCL